MNDPSRDDTRTAPAQPAPRDDLCAALSRAGQSVWLDDLDRRLLATGRLRDLIAGGSVSGLTSNPSITAAAIAANGYGEALREHRRADHAARETLEHLLLDDARAAAALLEPAFASSGGRDGFVSVEVDPQLALDSAATLDAARRLHRMFGHPNLLVKVPGTEAGLRAVSELTREGVSTNVTLLFDVAAVGRAERAYLEGLRARRAANQTLGAVMSVASLFVSRLDYAIDARLLLLDSGRGELLAQRGQAATAMATLAHEAWQAAGMTAEWRALARDGAHRQRLLFASTSVKESIYPATKYLRSLVYRDTVTTVPLPTLSAALAEPWGKGTSLMSLDAARGCLAQLAHAGLDLAGVVRDLEQDGLARFQAAQRAAVELVARRLAGD
jgi:transaldolase